MTSNSPSSAGYFLDNPVNGAVNGPPTSLLPSAKPQKKPKPPPLSLVPEAHFWPLLSPLAEFAAIATSPESPLVRETSLGGDIFDVTSRGYQRSYSTPPPSLVSDQNSRISEVSDSQ